MHSFTDKFPGKVKFNEPLAPYLAYAVGGPADILVFPKNGTDLDLAVKTAKELGLPVTVIGSGTNLLVLDGGIRGVVVSLREGFDQLERVGIDEGTKKIKVQCGGAVAKRKLLNWAIKEGLTGLEFSSGVPGTVGGGVFMNAGTKYGCYGDILEQIEIYDLVQGLKVLERSDFDFGYREQNAVKNSIVTEVQILLQEGNRETIQKEVDRIIAERGEKQPLDFPSCGSTFKNPEGASAGRLIEKAGLKGLSVGGAEISTKHANFILNKGNAKASDILALIRKAQQRVKEAFGVTLECEVIVLGDAAE